MEFVILGLIAICIGLLLHFDDQATDSEYTDTNDEGKYGHGEKFKPWWNRRQ